MHEGVPIAVLSNDDGYLTARSQEVKDAGVRMGEPFFMARDRLAAMGACVFNSDHTSRRVMETLEMATPDVEVYSIDEAFLSVPMPPGTRAGVCARMERRARTIRQRFDVVLARTAAGLSGVSCLLLEAGPVTRQTLVKSRSFGEPTRTPVARPT